MMINVERIQLELLYFKEENGYNQYDRLKKNKKSCSKTNFVFGTTRFPIKYLLSWLTFYVPIQLMELMVNVQVLHPCP
jgi:hypothetical protein